MEYWADAVAGLAGGVAQVAVGHPFDTVKVRMQAAGGAYSLGVVECLRATVRREGALALYNGVGPPLLGAGACTALLFGVHGRMRAIVRDSMHVSSPSVQALLAGAATGVAMAPVLCPFELVKIRLQVAGTATGPVYSGVWDCGTRSARTASGAYSLRPLFRGLSATVLRDVPSFAAYFGAYEALRPSSPDATPGRLVLAGGLAGVAAWLPAYPQDVIKSVMQGAPGSDGFYKTFMRVARSGGLFRGFAPMVARAFPANAATFLAYEAVRSLFPPYRSIPPDVL